MAVDIKNLIDYATKWFDPKQGLIQNQKHWQAFDYYVLAGQDLDKYKLIGSHPGQLDFLINSVHFENLLHAGNGFGKTDIIARKHIARILLNFWYPIKTKKEYKTLNIAITNEQAELVQDRIEQLVSMSPVLRPLIKCSVKHPRCEIRWLNGAVTEFKTTKRKAEAVEGHAYDYISCDEIALEPHLEFIRESILIPRLRNFPHPQMDWFATPKGFNAYYRLMNMIRRAGGFVRSGSSFENPHINHTLLRYVMSNYSEAKKAQVIFGQFVDNAQFMFASRIEKLINNDLEFENAHPAVHSYFDAWDLARGRKGETADSTVGYRFKQGEINRVVGRWSFQLPWTEKERENLFEKKEVHHSSIEREIRIRQREAKSKVFIDSTGVGDTLYGIVMDIAKPIDFRGTKDKILDHTQAVIDAGLVQCPFIPDLVDQMTTYERDDKNLDTDDLMAFCIGCYNIPLVRPDYGTLDL
jgi:hypothetical protein